MAIKIALILSVILQFGAAIIALTLIRRTRANIAWWLISLGFLLMAFRRVFEIEKVFGINFHISTEQLSSWTGVLISFIMLLSLAFIRRIFNLQKQFDELRKQNEARVLSAIIRTEENERLNFAKAAGMKLGKPLTVSDYSSADVRSAPVALMAKAADESFVGSQLPTGTLDITTTVSVVFELL